MRQQKWTRVHMWETISMTKTVPVNIVGNHATQNDVLHIKMNIDKPLKSGMLLSVLTFDIPTLPIMRNSQ